MKLKKYRVVSDSYAGFECQVWRWWFPFWVQMTKGNGLCNTHGSLEDAIKYIEQEKQILWQS